MGKTKTREAVIVEVRNDYSRQESLDQITQYLADGFNIQNVSVLGSGNSHKTESSSNVLLYALVKES